MQRQIVVLGIIVLCFMVGTALAADVTLGTWKVNLAKSKYSPGPAPKSQTVKYEMVGDSYKITVDGVDGEGKPIHNETTMKFDGKDTPVKGDPLVDTRAYKKIDEFTIEVVSKKGGKVTTTNKTVYARDGKSRTSTFTGVDAKGQTVNNTVFYDKQ